MNKILEIVNIEENKHQLKHHLSGVIKSKTLLEFIKQAMLIMIDSENEKEDFERYYNDKFTTDMFSIVKNIILGTDIKNIKSKDYMQSLLQKVKDNLLTNPSYLKELINHYLNDTLEIESYITETEELHKDINKYFEEHNIKVDVEMFFEKFNKRMESYQEHIENNKTYIAAYYFSGMDKIIYSAMLCVCAHILKEKTYDQMQEELHVLKQKFEDFVEFEQKETYLTFFRTMCDFTQLLDGNTEMASNIQEIVEIIKYMIVEHQEIVDKFVKYFYGLEKYDMIEELKSPKKDLTPLWRYFYAWLNN